MDSLPQAKTKTSHLESINNYPLYVSFLVAHSVGQSVSTNNYESIDQSIKSNQNQSNL